MKVVAALVFAALLAGCASQRPTLQMPALQVPTLFRVPVLQGNVVDGDKVQKLEPGMTTRQVRYLLGTPLIDNNFDDHRWDYVFYFRDRNANVMESQLSLFFEDDKLARIKGDKAYRAMLPEQMRELDVDKLTQPVPPEASPPPAPQPAPQPAPGPAPGPTDYPVTAGG